MIPDRYTDHEMSVTIGGILHSVHAMQTNRMHNKN